MGLIVNDEGVARELGGGRVEAVRWEHLLEIAIVTTDEGPFLEDFFWLLRGDDGTGVCVPQELASAHDLLGVLQRRFEDTFDNHAVIRASLCTDNATFTCWRRSEEGPTLH